MLLAMGDGGIQACRGNVDQESSILRLLCAALSAPGPREQWGSRAAAWSPSQQGGVSDALLSDQVLSGIPCVGGELFAFEMNRSRSR